jgi:hypothetical protein
MDSSFYFAIAGQITNCKIHAEFSSTVYCPNIAAGASKPMYIANATDGGLYRQLVVAQGQKRLIAAISLLSRHTSKRIESDTVM